MIPDTDPIQVLHSELLRMRNITDVKAICIRIVMGIFMLIRAFSVKIKHIQYHNLKCSGA